MVLGRNGAGKTTLLKSLMGVVPVPRAASNSAAWTSPSSSHERVRAGIGYVPQGREIFGRSPVMENLQMGLASKARHAHAVAG